MAKFFKSIQGPLGNMFLGDDKEAQTVTPVATQPDPQDPRLKTLARRTAAQRSSVGGRESTRLSGRGSFSSSQL